MKNDFTVASAIQKKILLKYQKNLDELVSKETKKLVKTDRMSAMLSGSSNALIHSTDEIKLLQQVCELIFRLGEYKFVWVGYAKNNDIKLISPVAKVGKEKRYLNSVKLDWNHNNFGDSPMGIAINTKKTFVEQNTQLGKSHKIWRKNIIKCGFNSVVSIPLIADQIILGGITIYSDKFNDFPKDNIKILEEMANDLAYGIMVLREKIAIEDAKNEFEYLLKRTVGVIATISEKRDPYTAGHQERTAFLARAIAKEMGFPDEYANIIHLSTTIHDVGKIHIPTETLSYPGILLWQEIELIRTHPAIGYEIAKHVNFPWPEVGNIILQHHERLDGSGYPSGLKAKNISLEAQIVAVADVVEAMSSHRPYRPGLGIDAALKEVSTNKNTKYNAEAVDACIKLFKNKKFILPVSQGK